MKPNNTTMNSEQLGPTGNFPDGKIDESDNGEFTLAIGIHQDNVIMDFRTEVCWIGFNPEQAKEIGESLIKHAETLLNPKPNAGIQNGGILPSEDDIVLGPSI